MYVSVLHVYVFVCLVPMKIRRAHWIRGAGVTEGDATVRVLGRQSGPLQEQKVLLLPICLYPPLM